VLLHLGSVSIHSKLGSGTTVQADIPCDLGAKEGP
jgi:hypothetical protein